jgi:sRNA-binding regulator protein Hfq
VNRKLIRPTLAEVKNRGEAAPPDPRERAPERERTGERERSGGDRERGGERERSGGFVPRPGGSYSRPPSSGGSSRPMGGDAATGRKRIPPSETNAEIFYYKKQMDAHTVMVIVLKDGEEVEGTIEWYDRAALKVNRRGAPNILLLKHNIKYMFKAEDRDGGGSDEG